MPCNTCVEMSLDNESMTQELLLLKRRNKINRAVIRSLRDKVKELQDSSDALIETLKEADYSLDLVDKDNLAPTEGI